MTATPVTARPVLVGNRLVLAGSVLYLLEWVAIFAASVDVPLGAEASTADVTSGYAGHTTALGWASGWFSVVLLGRLLIVTGIRSALADSGRPRHLMDVAVLAMGVSVAIEITTYAVVPGAAWYLDHGGSIDTVRALDAATFTMNNAIFGPLGVAVLCSAAAMWSSGLFPRVLCALGVVAGVGNALVGLMFSAPAVTGIAEMLRVAVVLFWVWMLWTGVLCWRRTTRVPGHDH